MFVLGTSNIGIYYNIFVYIYCVFLVYFECIESVFIVYFNVFQCIYNVF
jgi:hypothetical protein